MQRREQILINLSPTRHSREVTGLFGRRPLQRRAYYGYNRACLCRCGPRPRRAGGWHTIR